MQTTFVSPSKITDEKEKVRKREKTLAIAKLFTLHANAINEIYPKLTIRKILLFSLWILFKHYFKIIVTESRYIY